MIREWMPQSLTGRQVPRVDEAKRETEEIVSVVSANGKQPGALVRVCTDMSASHPELKFE
jgi:aspartokinase